MKIENENRTLWTLTKDGDSDGLKLYLRHYSSKYRRSNSKLFVGPGEKMVLITSKKDALFVWRRYMRNGESHKRLECAVFRNESAYLSSVLILDAERWAATRWPHERNLWTWIDEREVKSANPGYCFKVIGWKSSGHVSKSGLIEMVKDLDGRYS